MSADENVVVAQRATEVQAAPMAATASSETQRRQLAWFERTERFIAILAGPDLIFEFANAAYGRLAGGRPLLGVSVRKAFPEVKDLGVFEILDGVMMTGRRYVARQMPVTLVADGRAETRVLDFIYEPIRGPDGRPAGILVDGLDLTDNPDDSVQGVGQIRRREALLAELNVRFSEIEDPADLSYAAAEVIGSWFGVSRAGYGVVDLAREDITIERDWNAPGIRSIAGVLNFRDYGTYIEELKHGQTVVCVDAFLDPRTIHRAEALKAISAQAFVNMPVSEQGGLVALLYLNHAQARIWTPEELALIREVADRTRVAEARRRAEMALRASERRLRLAVDAAQMAVWEYDAVLERLKPSPELNVMLGYPPEAEPDLGELRARYHDDDRFVVRDAAQAALARGDRFFEAQHRFRRPDGDWRWFLLRAEILIGDDRSPIGVVGVLLDITAQKVAEQALREGEAELKAALDAGSLAPFDFDHVAGVMKPSPRLNELYGYPPGLVLTLADLRARYHPDDRDDFLEQARAHQNASPLRPFAWQIRLLLPGGQVRWIEGRGEYERSPAGKIVRSRGVIMDINERKTAEERQRLLVSELDHRVKNTLAIVQGLAQQSFRAGQDPERARSAFEARLAALAAAHNLLTRNSWTATSISELVGNCLAGPLGEDAARVECSGPDVRLPPQTAVSIALALHELCTNAVKYGALSSPSGRVRIGWSLSGDRDRRSLHLSWRESGGPPVEPPTRRGFGSRMIERGLAAELGGRSSLKFERTGVQYDLDAPSPMV